VQKSTRAHRTPRRILSSEDSSASLNSLDSNYCPYHIYVWWIYSTYHLSRAQWQALSFVAEVVDPNRRYPTNAPIATANITHPLYVMKMSLRKGEKKPYQHYNAQTFPGWK
jgi:hypothetical protein